MKFPKSKHSVLIPLYGGSLWFFDNIPAMQRACNWFTPGHAPIRPHSAGFNTVFLGSKNGEYHGLLGVFDGQQRTLVHESAHATFAILDHVGVRPSFLDQEPFAYMQDFIYNAFAKHV